MKRESVLIIEDDADIRSLVEHHLKKEGFTPILASDGESGLKSVAVSNPDLIILDLMLPGIDGLDVCRELKQDKNTADIPIIMLTAKCEESDIIVGLNLGADDYLVKPFSYKVLIARIKAILRRCGKNNAEKGGAESVIKFGPVMINDEKHEVKIEGEIALFTLAEYRLLKTLCHKPGRVFTRNHLLDVITGGEATVIDRNIDVHIRSLRKKLGKVSDIIVTVRGIGYKCCDDEL